ncbi:uncharacterized protein THITE_120736 [Thermothielavioides terrestris NRRL 8126]|uniref:Elongator complex protein 5 n=1 Tax=Thermothielavioides terrestris (strain ATCC 38088 / NRRL 8126) TaxID=578455 RepID=G2QU87_THETT|nr:uncharacterized protein THITE_120736 [Thermothielavioides terrestris NRRL 8126]AEO62839.1 hypothetical protein THITE_120736 [Thermothielavioides terrestris NRRL 8126]
MAPSAQAHKRAHSLLLFEKLLNLRDAASPLNILLDTLEQGAQPLTNEFMRRAKIERAKIVYVSFATIKKPAVSDVFIKAWGKSLKALAAEIAAHVAPPRGASKDTLATPQKSLIIIDTLNPLASQTPHLLPSFFTSILPPGTSLVAVYHTDVPALPVALPGTGPDSLRAATAAAAAAAEYLPDALTLLAHLATAVFRVSSLGHAVAARRARERSLAEPQWGLREGREGVLVGLRAGVGEDGLVVEMEMRRKSGRAVAERFVLVQRTDGRGLGVVVMDDHPAFRKAVGGGEGEGEEEGMVATFNLSLTEKQRKDREGVVLPYFDAQVEVGGGEGGRILYEMGREDDFDEEEDEI